MNDQNDHLEPLEELGNDFTEASAATTAPPMGPPPMMGAPMMIGAPAIPADKQYYQFLWGAIAVLFGCLLPFNRSAEGWLADEFQPELHGPIGLMTVAGSIVAFCAILTIGAQLYSIKYRKVFLMPIVLMLFVCLWAALRGFSGFGAEELGYRFTPADDVSTWTAAEYAEQRAADFAEKGAKGPMSMLYDGRYFVDYWQHVGPGYLFTLAGSLYVVLKFFGAVLGIKKKPATAGGAPAAAAAGGDDKKGGARRGGRKR